MSSTGPNIAAASIPNITVLREKLEYGDSRSDRCDAFNDDIRVFRKRYRTSSGLPGVDLYDWRSSEHQSALTEMANAYLEKEGNGSVYWPDDDTSPNHNGLQFSKDHQLIKTLMKQLIFRLNQQQYRNNKYKKKGHPGADDLHRRGRSTTDSIDVVAAEPNPDDSLRGHPDIWLTSHTPSSVEPVAERADTLDQGALDSAPSLVNVHEFMTNSAAARNAHDTNTVDEDVCALPSSPKPPPPTKQHRITTLRVGRGRGGAASQRETTNIKRNLRSEGTPAQVHLAKRLKTHQICPTGADIESHDQDLSSLVATKRTSSRRRKTTRRPNRATDEQMYEAIASPTPTEEPASEIDSGESKSPRRTSEDFTSFVREKQPARIGEERSNGTWAGCSSPPRVIDLDIAATTAQHRGSFPNIPSSDMSRPNSRPLPTPSSIAEAPEESRQASEQKDLAKQMLQDKINVEFVYRVILSRSPVYQCKGWHPRGRFQDKSMKEVLHELLLDGNVEGLLFTLEGPGMRLEEQIDRDDEPRFEVMKRHFYKQIRACRANHSDPKTPLMLEFEIEPLRGEDHTKREEAEDADLDW